MHNKLLNLFKENRTDNQEVLEMLFALKDDLPLKDCSSQAKVVFFQNICESFAKYVSQIELGTLDLLAAWGVRTEKQCSDTLDHKGRAPSYRSVTVAISTDI